MLKSARSDPNKLAFAVTLGAGFMSLLDVSIVNVALPSIETSLSAAPSSLQWIVAGYTLSFGLVLIVGGRLGDTLGRRKLFLFGLTVFVVTSAACGLVTTAPALAIMRLAQGIGAGFLSPQVIGFIQQLFSGSERARAFGMFGAVVGIATATGPLLGGVLIAIFGAEEGWRAVFLVNVPIGAVLIPLAVKLLPRDEPGERSGQDILGLALLGVAVLAIMLPFIQASEAQGGIASLPWWLLVVGAVMLMVFVLWERFFEARGGNVVLPRALVRTRSFTFGAAVGLIYFAGFTSIFLLVTLFLQDGLGLTPLQAGLVQTPFALAGGVSAVAGGRLVMKIGRWSVVLGIAIMITGLVATDLVVRFTDPATTPLLVALTLMFSGAGNGLVISPNQTLALAQVPLAYAGTAGATLQTLQRIGTSTGLAVTTGVFFASLATRSDDGEGYARALGVGLIVTISIVGLALVVALVDALRRQRTGDVTPHDAPSPAPHG